MRSGWVKLHRKIIDSEMYKNLNSKQRDVMIQCLLLANHEQNTWEWGQKLHTCQPGQFITSINSLAGKCSSDTKVQSVRTSLLKLEKWQFLTSESTKSGRLITILNWESYQKEVAEANKDGNRQLTKSQQTANKELTTIKNVKKEKKKNKEDKSLSPTEKPVGVDKEVNNPKPKEKKPRKPDELFDAISEVFNISPKGTGGGRIGRLKKLFKDHGATPDEIRRRAKAYREVHPTWDLTAEAVEKHWASLVSEIDLDLDPLNYEQQMSHFRPMYGWDWNADDSHEDVWEAEAAKFKATKAEYGKWRRDYSEKNGPYSEDRPTPECEYPFVKPKQKG